MSIFGCFVAADWLAVLFDLTCREPSNDVSDPVAPIQLEVAKAVFMQSIRRCRTLGNMTIGLARSIDE